MPHLDLPNAYWVPPAQLLAGPYPCAADLDAANQQVAALLRAGVDFILDLTEPGEYNLRAYAPLLNAQAAAAGLHVARHSHPIPDLGVPSPVQMRHILDRIDGALHAGRTVYVHCFGGIGRTGTVVGCYLVRQGMSGEEALKTITRLRRDLPKSDRPSPETRAQRALVRTWRD